MNSENPFSKIASQYSTWRPRYPTTLFDRLIEFCPTHQSAWDCATGSGQAAIDLARYFSQVEATDSSADQIAAATQAANVHYSVQPAENTHFPDHHFDLVTVAQALHWFDHDRFWKEVHRVLKPDGVFAAWTYVWPHISPDIDAVVQEMLEIIRPYWSTKNQIAWNGYRELSWPFIELPVPKIEFSCRWNRDQFLSYVRTWSATTRCIEHQGEAFFTEFTAMLSSVWRSEQIKKVEMEFHCRAGRKPSV